MSTIEPVGISLASFLLICFLTFVKYPPVYLPVFGITKSKAEQVPLLAPSIKDMGLPLQQSV